MSERTRGRAQAWGLLILVVLGLGVRLLAASLGQNYDMESYQIVAGIVRQGGNVYAGTTRYNYGPVWFSLIWILDRLAGLAPAYRAPVFRYLIALLLSLVDLGIAYVLWRRTNLATACLFWFNPLSILVTGYYSQFDNLAVWLGLLAVQVLGDDWEAPLGRRKWAGLGLLALSLMTKHILFAFPVWLAAKQKGLRHKLLVVLVPVLLFMASFGPFLGRGQYGIVRNVFLYKSRLNAFFYQLFVPGGLQLLLPSTLVWLLALAIGALVFRRKGGLESLLLYTGVLVATSPAIADQYLAIPAPLLAAYPNPLSALYVLLGTLHLGLSSDGLHLAWLQRLLPVESFLLPLLLIAVLSLDLIWLTWHGAIRAGLKRALLEIRAQLKF